MLLGGEERKLEHTRIRGYVTDAILNCELYEVMQFENVHSELPYSVLVETEYYKELDDGSIHIDQTIYVNKENHKSMIIGAGARMVKKIGIEAREQLEQILGVKVTLKLYVKFKEDWTKNENFIKNVIGISGS